MSDSIFSNQLADLLAEAEYAQKLRRSCIYVDVGILLWAYSEIGQLRTALGKIAQCDSSFEHRADGGEGWPSIEHRMKDIARKALAGAADEIENAPSG